MDTYTCINECEIVMHGWGGGTFSRCEEWKLNKELDYGMFQHFCQSITFIVKRNKGLYGRGNGGKQERTMFVKGRDDVEANCCFCYRNYLKYNRN